MSFFALVLLLIVFSAAKSCKKDEFNSEYISRGGTTPIKGIFVVLILFSHAKGYFSSLFDVYDQPYLALQGHLNQMIVAMFMFYSGYGIYEQIKKREFSYIKSIPAKRFPSLLLNYDIAVLFFVILALCLHNKLTVKGVLLSLIAWEGIGNSSWYIFVTFCLYIITFISFCFIGKIKNKKLYIINIIILTALTILLIYILQLAGKERWWYNTAFLFVLGFWYSYFKEPIEKLVMRSDLSYITTAGIIATAYVFANLHRGDSLFMFYVFGSLFCLLCVIITMKVKIESGILNWFGNHVFSVYILQRIPMIALSHLGLATSNKYVFTIVSIAITCIMAEAYDRAFAKLSGKIWKPKKINN